MDGTRPPSRDGVALATLPWWRRSRALFLAAFLFVALVAGGARVADVIEGYRRAEEQALTSHAETAAALAKATETFIGQYVRVVDSTAHATFHGALPGPARHRFLLTIRRTYPEIDGILVLDQTGRVIDADERAAQLIGRDLSDRAYYRAIAGGAATVVGDLILSRASGIASVPMAVAARAPDGRLLGVVVLGLHASTIGRHLELRLSGDAFPVLVDRTGRVIFDGAFADLLWEQRDYSGVPPVAEALAGRQAPWAGYRSPVTHEPRIGAVVPVAGIGWAVGVLQPLDAAFAPARREFHRALVSTGVVLGSGIGLALLLGLWLSRPVVALARGVAALAEGGLDHRVQIRSRNEFGWLADAFNRMAARLEDASRQERQLNDELTITNEELQANMTRLEESMGELEAAKRRATFLAEIGTELASSLEYEATLRNVARLAVPDIADWCFVDLEGDGVFTRRVAVAYGDPSWGPLAGELERIAFRLDSEHPVPTALRTGQAELVPDVTDAWLTQMAEDSAQLEKLRRLDPRSYIFMPLVARGRTLGVMSFVATTSRRHYGHEDVALTQELARRAALAVDNARLYHEAQAVQTELRQIAVRLEEHAATLDAERGRFEAVLRQMPAGVIVVEAPSGRFVLGNAQAAEILGRTPPDALDFRAYEAYQGVRLDGRRYEPGQWPLSRSIRTGEVIADEEIDILRGDTRAVIRVSSAPVRDRDGRIVAGVATFHDVTQRRQMESALRTTEEQLRQAQKMDAVGKLAGGVAHDFNNLLTAITGYSELLLREHGDGQAGRDLEEIRRAADRAAGLTRQLLAFSRQQVLQPRVLDLNAAVAEMDRMLQRLIGEDIELQAHLEPGLGRIKADPGQVEQVIMNLAVNARDAMPDGGKLTIETANVELDEAYAREHASVEPGPYVMLAVTDSGCGMTPDVQARIFEPFFTTKEQGKGTGLGLSTVYGIVKQSGGNVWVYSESGKGTTFKVYFPRVDDPLDTRASTRRPAQPAGGAETVLLVEDEEGVRALARRVLREAGYTVLEARDGEEAVKVSTEHQGAIALMVTDMVMPGASGPGLASRLAARRPEMKVLYMSGYTDKAILRQVVFRPGTPFLDKPFTPAGLANKVREVLDTPPPTI